MERWSPLGNEKQNSWQRLLLSGVSCITAKSHNEQDHTEYIWWILMSTLRSFYRSFIWLQRINKCNKVNRSIHQVSVRCFVLLEMSYFWGKHVRANIGNPLKIPFCWNVLWYCQKKQTKKPASESFIWWYVIKEASSIIQRPYQRNKK